MYDSDELHLQGYILVQSRNGPGDCLINAVVPFACFQQLAQQQQLQQQQAALVESIPQPDSVPGLTIVETSTDSGDINNGTGSMDLDGSMHTVTEVTGDASDSEHVVVTSGGAVEASVGTDSAVDTAAEAMSE